MHADQQCNASVGPCQTYSASLLSQFVIIKIKKDNVQLQIKLFIIKNIMKYLLTILLDNIQKIGKDNIDQLYFCIIDSLLSCKYCPGAYDQAQNCRKKINDATAINNNIQIFFINKTPSIRVSYCRR